MLLLASTLAIALLTAHILTKSLEAQNFLGMFRMCLLGCEVSLQESESKYFEDGTSQ